MNCERCQAELEDFLYGELDDASAVAVRAHLAACAACVQAREALERENEIFAEYYEQTALEPAPELWTAIRTRIREEAPAQTTDHLAEPTKPHWLTGLVAWFAGSLVVRQTAFALSLIVLSVAATTLYFKTQRADNQQIAQATPTPVAAPGNTLSVKEPSVAPEQAPQQDLATQQNAVKPAPRVTPKVVTPLSETQQIQNQLARAEREYQNAIKLLDRVIARQRDQFAPGLLKQYESSLALIDNSIAESRRALRERPDDAASGQFLLAAYAKKLELMQEIATQAGQ